MHSRKAASGTVWLLHIIVLCKRIAPAARIEIRMLCAPRGQALSRYGTLGVAQHVCADAPTFGQGSHMHRLCWMHRCAYSSVERVVAASRRLARVVRVRMHA
eukprot:796323-Prymnesium_polylepis.3